MPHAGPRSLILQALGSISEDIEVSAPERRKTAAIDGVVEYIADLDGLPDDLDTRLRALDPVAEVASPDYRFGDPCPIQFWWVHDGWALEVAVLADPDPHPDERFATVVLACPDEGVQADLMGWVRRRAMDFALSELEGIASRLADVPKVLGWAPTLYHLRDAIISAAAKAEHAPPAAPWIRDEPASGTYQVERNECMLTKSGSMASAVIAGDYALDLMSESLLLIPYDDRLPRVVDRADYAVSIDRCEVPANSWYGAGA